jgi:hypothetical protein
MRLHANEDAIGPAELAQRRRHRLQVGLHLLQLARRPRTIDDRRAQRGLRLRQVRHDDVADLGVDDSCRRAFHREPQLQRPRRRFEHDTLRTTPGCAGRRRRGK